MASTITHDGETLDDVVFRIYGDRPSMLGELAAANPDIIGLGIRLPAGLNLNLPAITETPKTATTINLWN